MPQLRRGQPGLSQCLFTGVDALQSSRPDKAVYVPQKSLPPQEKWALQWFLLVLKKSLALFAEVTLLLRVAFHTHFHLTPIDRRSRAGEAFLTSWPCNGCDDGDHRQKNKTESIFTHFPGAGGPFITTRGGEVWGKNTPARRQLRLITGKGEEIPLRIFCF